MKKSVPFIPFLALSAAAPAALYLTFVLGPNGEMIYSPGEGVLIQATVNDLASFDSSPFLAATGPGQWILPEVNLGSQLPGPIVNSWGWEFFNLVGFGSGWKWPDNLQFGSLPAGIIGKFGFLPTGQGDSVITIMDMNTLEISDQLILHQIPEPATLALFGFGMLLIRRKRLA
jgi:hypothetical protein